MSGRGRKGGQLRRAAPTGSLHTHQPHRSSVIQTSADGRRAVERTSNIDVQPGVPDYYQDDLQTNAAVEADDFSYGLGDDSLPPEVQGPSMDGIELQGKKKKRTENSTWATNHRDEYLDEVIRLNGRGDKAFHMNCCGCGEASPKFRCEHQTCVGADMYCAECIVKNHRALPAHWIEEWKGTVFKRTSLAKLGLVVQLGHPRGYGCPNSTDAHKNFTLINDTGIHTINLRFCGARWWPATSRDPQTCATFAVIRLFRFLNCQGKLTAHDFMKSLELLTNNDGLTPPPSRRRAFREIVRQYRMNSPMVRAGRGHDDSGIAGTAQGELAPLCRQCPQPGKNLETDWEKINWDLMPEDLRYKYFTFLAQDCNFRLINRDISTEAKDPIVDDGLGHFVNNSLYTTYLRDHVSDEEISSCSGFQAMFLANTKWVKGLRATGVGGVTCARHNIWRPNGIGDLQLGERFCNMDFILLSAVLNLFMLYLILSYDIACQFSKKFWERMPGLPSQFHLNIPKKNVWWKVPNFHLKPHKPFCHSPYSFHYMWGAGWTHGETVEQNWEFTNGAAGSTKMMGRGARHATLEDLFGYHNWRRTVSNRGILARRMAEDVVEGQEHREAFEAFDAALASTVPELTASWKKWVHEWESKQHTDGNLSPFELSEKVYSMKEIRMKMATDGTTHDGEGEPIVKADTVSSFILMGLDIEQSQRILAVDVKAIADPTALQTLDFAKRRAGITRQIRAFRKLQRRYMPHLRRYMTVVQRASLDTEGERLAEEVRVFLPSSILEASKRSKACATGLAAIEEELHEAEALEALEDLRQGLRCCTLTNRYRLDTIPRRIKRLDLRHLHEPLFHGYRFARNALMWLRGNGAWERKLRVLEEGDIRALNERVLSEEEEAEKEKLVQLGAFIEGGVAGVGSVATGETHRKLSWIWYTSKATDPSEAELTDALRIEWCKAYARTRRWREDVVLVEEEMRRTIEFGYWMAATWEMRAGARTRGVDEPLHEGLNAYAQEQLERKWAGIRAKGRAYLAGEALGEGARVLVNIDGEGGSGEGDDDDDEAEERELEEVEEEDGEDDDDEED
ncbi:hypothetical protein DFH07DRAFT_868558 [Mycena maculata]|uniref:CxC2-like cysteine cluster KDZ transposase-associated domain-containing protein n=1 Tax=Mycena maculata TaxID=230809 RepID=A0AAD7J2K1_9AGAR|nr:hypothetical protein DFH07DRAFT_868558 [Mycena maculata]